MVRGLEWSSGLGMLNPSTAITAITVLLLCIYWSRGASWGCLQQSGNFARLVQPARAGGTRQVGEGKRKGAEAPNPFPESFVAFVSMEPKVHERNSHRQSA